MIPSGEREDKPMTAVEASRLADWLEEHGHDAEDFRDCIKAIAGVKEKDLETVK